MVNSRLTRCAFGSLEIQFTKLRIILPRMNETFALTACCSLPALFSDPSTYAKSILRVVVHVIEIVGMSDMRPYQRVVILNGKCTRANGSTAHQVHGVNAYHFSFIIIYYRWRSGVDRTTFDTCIKWTTLQVESINCQIERAKINSGRKCEIPAEVKTLWKNKEPPGKGVKLHLRKTIDRMHKLAAYSLPAPAFRR